MCVSRVPRCCSRAPHGGVLYHFLVAKFPGYLESRIQAGRPPFMLADVNAFLGCGDPKRSYAILRCLKCHLLRSMPLSCKRRSFCEPCGVRRQQERTEFLQHQIFGSRPVRLWTLTLPFPFRIELG